MSNELKRNQYVKISKKDNYYSWIETYIYGKIDNIFSDSIMIKLPPIDNIAMFSILEFDHCNIEIIDNIEYNLSI